ncbi:dynamin family protein [Agrococcus casei]|uniref:dynamin family protein n=1 Tax=Agrococcus casei TaxID=343512 RepID=UPI003F907E72
MPGNQTDAPQALRSTLEETQFALDADSAAKRDDIVRQLADYVQPRLERLDAPLLAVVGGSTGAGKSTLVNALVGRRVSASGVIRPTTRQPLIVCHPDDERWFSDSRILPSLARVRSDGATGESADGAAMRILATDSMPSGLALLDAPDFDSIDDGNRALAAQLLAAADLWLFVTTPARYADALPWQFLHRAAERDIEVAVVLNRVDEEARESIAADLQVMLTEAGLGDARLFEVGTVSQFDEVLPAESIERIRKHLHGLAEDAQSRRAVAARTLVGAARDLASGVDALADARARELERASAARALVAAEYAEATEQVIEATSDGRLLRDEVLGRWQDFVGTSDVFRKVEQWFSGTVDRIGRFFTGKPEPLQAVETEIEHGLHAVIIDAGESTAARAWRGIGRTEPQLRDLDTPRLATASADLSGRSAQLIREWQASLVETIQASAGGKRMRARIMSLGLNAITVALMIVVFASTGGLTGGEIAIAGGSAVVGQKLLETIFGEDAVRRLAAKAKTELNERVDRLMSEEAKRYEVLLEQLEAGSSADELRERARDVVELAESAVAVGQSDAARPSDGAGDAS